jgi:RNA polymerase sigma-70 factor (ECF subfamily)
MEAGDAAAVLSLARRGDADAFRALVEHHGRSAFGLAFRLTGNAQDAEEVVQESFLRAYRQLGRFEARSNFGTWLHRIVVNCSMDVLRARQTRRHQQHVGAVEDVAETLPAGGPCPEQLARSAEIERHVDASLDVLTVQERAAFTLRHREGRSIEEIGRVLGLQKSAAKHAVFRAVRKLRVALEPLRDQLGDQIRRGET